MKDIGGYIELEIPQRGEYHKTLALNSARNCIRYLIRAYNIKSMYVPIYQCPLVFEAIKKENCEIIFYEIDENFLPKKSFEKDAYILYVNYFGLCDKNVDSLSRKYPHLIVDNSQAFYAPPKGFATCYSPRKFFGVSDGGYLYCQKESTEKLEQDHDSWKRFSHLLKRIEVGSNFWYPDFKTNDGSLDTEEPKFMSNLTHYILGGVDYKRVADIRKDNFRYLQKHLGAYNEISVSLEEQVPMYYPFVCHSDRLRQKLLQSNIYVSTFWEGIESYYKADSCEKLFHNYLFPLIIDQRCSVDDLNRQIDLIKKEIFSE